MSSENFVFYSDRIDFTEVVYIVTTSLEEDGYKIVSRINLQTILKENLNIDYHPYTIIGLCSPIDTFKSLINANHLRAILPSRVFIQQIGKHKFEISTVGSNLIENEEEDINSGGIDIGQSIKIKLRTLSDPVE